MAKKKESLSRVHRWFWRSRRYWGELPSLLAFIVRSRPCTEGCRNENL